MSGTAARCYISLQLQSVETMDLEEEVLMLALLSKKIYKNKHCHQYWVYPLLCTKLEMCQSYTLFYELRKDDVFSSILL